MPSHMYMYMYMYMRRMLAACHRSSLNLLLSFLIVPSGAAASLWAQWYHLVRNQRVRPQDLDCGGGCVFEITVGEHPILEIACEIVRRVGYFRLDVIEHRLPRAALPVVVLGAGVEERAEVFWVQVDEGLIRRD